MNEIETGKLLTFISGLDNRKISKEVVLAWHQLLDDTHFDDAIEAAKQHYRESREWLMPADLVKGAQRVRYQNERWQTVMRWAADARLDAYQADEEFDAAAWFEKLSRRDDVSAYVRERAALEAQQGRANRAELGTTS